MDSTVLAYIAGFLDGDGSIFFQIVPRKDYTRKFQIRSSIAFYQKSEYNQILEWLKHMFDHTYLVAEDDPELDTFVDLAKKDLVDLRIVSATGCERFAEMAFDKADEIVKDISNGRCWVQSATVREHAHNSATCELADHQKIHFSD